MKRSLPQASLFSVQEIDPSLGEWHTRRWQRRNTHRGMKWCAHCKQWKMESAFSAARSASDGLNAYCRPCAKERGTQEWLKRQDISNDANYRKRYGITLEDYNELFKKQHGLCAICRQAESTIVGKRGIDSTAKKRLAVDHCHKTGAVRGLLCTNCNKAVGSFKDSPELLARAIEYLQKQK